MMTAPCMPTPVSALFDVEAARFDGTYDARSAAGHSLRARTSAILAALDGRTGDVLDAGMGPGRLCGELARRSWRVSGVDLSSAMVAYARARLPDAAERLVEGHIESLPMPDESFDAVVASGAIEYVADRRAALSELARVLRPGGTAVVTVPNRRAGYRIWRHDVIYPAARLAKRAFPLGRPAPIRRQRVRSPEDFAQMLGQAGLSVESIAYTSYLVLPTPLELVLPSLTIQIAQRLERQQPRLAPRLATQIVFVARKDDGAVG